MQIALSRSHSMRQPQESRSSFDDAWDLTNAVFTFCPFYSSLSLPPSVHMFRLPIFLNRQSANSSPRTVSLLALLAVKMPLHTSRLAPWPILTVDG